MHRKLQGICLPCHPRWLGVSIFGTTFEELWANMPSGLELDRKLEDLGVAEPGLNLV